LLKIFCVKNNSCRLLVSNPQTMSYVSTLQQCLNAISTHTAPPVWASALPIIQAESAQFQAILAAGKVPIYGATTRVGHRDHERLSAAEVQAFQAEFLASHAIGDAPWYGDRIARCIGYAKLYALAAGGSGISSELYQRAIATVLDPDFAPQVPQRCSYSCGDVIPGAHWAQALLNHPPQYPPAAGEVMALLNGSFVHVGYTLGILAPLEQLGTLLIEATRLNNQLVQANRVNFAAPCRWHAQAIVQSIAESLGTDYADYRRQDPVSVRATPQIIETFVEAGRSLYQQLDYQLRSPSGNPLFSLEVDYPLSQASFLAPSLSLKTEAMIEAILFALWASVSRTQYLLSGQVAAIAADGANAQSASPLIQFPKLMMSILERCRQLAGRRIFAAGAQTSNGTEDLWTYGVNTTEQLHTLCEEGAQLLAIELFVLVKCGMASGLLKQSALQAQIQAAVMSSATHGKATQTILSLVKSDSSQATQSLLQSALMAIAEDRN
jgi:histidine ammonia-lyase